MRNRFTQLLIALLFIHITSLTSLGASDITVEVNSQIVYFPDTQPIIMNNRVYVPVRFVAENIGADVDWFPADRVVSITMNSVNLNLRIGQPTLIRNDGGISATEKSMDVVPVIINDRTLLPIRFVVEEFGYIVGWDDSLRRVSISRETHAAPGTADPSQMDAEEFEGEILRLVNAEREKLGISPLLWDSALASAARKHSMDMAENDFFSHASPNGDMPAERAAMENFAGSYIGENISAGRSTPEETMAGWMGSQGHRENILRPEYTHIGVGSYQLKGSRYIYYCTQVFGRITGST